MNELSDKERPKKLEDIFREGMEEAKMAPSDQLWNRIEHELDLKETIYYKKKMNWYQMVAAACLALLVCAGGYFYYDLETTHKTDIVALRKNQPELNQTANNANAKVKEDTSNKAATNNELADRGEFTNAEKPIIENEVSRNNSENNQTSAITKNQIVATSRVRNNNASTFKSQNTTARGANNQVIAKTNNTATEQFNSALNTNAIATIEEKAADKSIETTTDKAETGIEDINALEAKAFAFNSKLVLPDSLKSIAMVSPALAALTAEENIDKKKSSRWSVSGKYSPHYFNQNIALTQKPAGFKGAQADAQYMALSANAATPSSYSQALNEFDENTSAQFSYNAGVQTAYQLNKHWAIETGVDYAQNMASTPTSYIFKNQVSPATRLNLTNSFSSADKSLAPETVSFPTTALVASMSDQGDMAAAQIIKTPTFETRYRYRLIGVPVKINYKTKEGKSFYYASLGILNNLLMQAHILTDSPKVPDIKYAPDKDSPFRNWQVAALASVGKGFRFGKSFNVQAGIEATQYLTSLAANPDNLNGGNRKPYTLGLALSSGYTFGR